MQKKLAAAALCSVLGACGGGASANSAPGTSTASASPPPPAPPSPPASTSQIVTGIDLTTVLSVQAHSNHLYTDSTTLYEQPDTDPWDPYVWAQNAGALPSLDGDPVRQAATKQALLDELAQHVSGDLVIATYDYQDDVVAVDGPWRSGFSNAVVAIGLMNLGENDRALTYLSAIPDELAFQDGGYTWYPEYIDPTSIHHFDVMNGHFYAVGAMYDYWRRTGDPRFASAILAGLVTMQHELPLLVDPQEKCFLYSAGASACDYGQERAMNFASAACQMFRPICPEAQVYQQTFIQWNSQSAPASAAAG